MTKRHGRPVVIVAEDHAISRAFVVSELTAAGYIAIPHADAGSALAYIAFGERADALVTDVRMPGSLDGRLLAVEARLQRPHLPVVYISGRPIDENAMVSGGRFLLKPYAAGSLTALLPSVMRSSTAHMMAETWSLRTEIVRRFLVESDGWTQGVTRQYSHSDGLIGELFDTEVRVHREGLRAWISVKAGQDGLRRTEFKFDIPEGQVDILLDAHLSAGCIEKVRHVVPYGGVTWRVDVYQGYLTGIVLAEVALRSETQVPDLPSWVGAEVTEDPQFTGGSLRSFRWREV